MIHHIYFTMNREDGSPVKPTRGYQGDAGWDLVCSRTVTIWPKQFTDMHTDICMALPYGFFGRIVGRSSTFRKRGLLVSEGIIDNGFRGELFIGVYNITDDLVAVSAGERIAQLIVHKIHNTSWIEAERLPQTDRGSHGFGSTGV